MAKIFLAEDDPLMSRMYERAFRLAGHDLTMAFDGEEALEKIRKVNPPPVLAILDVMMPKKSGFDVLREMKADPQLKSIPTILLTNLAGQADAEKGLEIGAVVYLIKSQYSPKQVIEKVDEIIKSYSGGKEVPDVKVEVKDVDKK
jgi:DNA-binding response OmpR family regulator